MNNMLRPNPKQWKCGSYRVVDGYKLTRKYDNSHDCKYIHILYPDGMEEHNVHECDLDYTSVTRDFEKYGVPLRVALIALKMMDWIDIKEKI